MSSAFTSRVTLKRNVGMEQNSSSFVLGSFNSVPRDNEDVAEPVASGSIRVKQDLDLSFTTIEK